ncbi:MAG TPA: ABC transporter ATP-binding protein [Chthoniobacteraceae bacterium]|jgi:putative ABC transport system ATP-binding protein/lipoprotein-releasing system ATP-binding protein|nr:ABC transporter ATP-binding protein [Chthoniobacteraceae bacterium]
MFLIATDLHRSFRLGTEDIAVLRGISLTVEKGERVFLCGASGAGKTTLLYTLAGLERPEAGTILLDGQQLYKGSELTQARIRNERVGFIFQGYFLLPELTALENAMLPAMIGKRADPARAKAALERVGLRERLNHLPAELSGGEQQRVAIARALINKPGIIFADEPTGNLDSKTGESIIELLFGIASEEKTALVVVTHDPHLALRGDRRLEIKDGKLE